LDRILAVTEDVLGQRDRQLSAHIDGRRLDGILRKTMADVLGRKCQFVGWRFGVAKKCRQVDGGAGLFVECDGCDTRGRGPIVHLLDRQVQSVGSRITSRPFCCRNNNLCVAVLVFEMLDLQHPFFDRRLHQGPIAIAHQRVVQRLLDIGREHLAQVDQRRFRVFGNEFVAERLDHLHGHQLPRFEGLKQGTPCLAASAGAPFLTSFGAQLRENLVPESVRERHEYP
jgi:hypothetical protein